MGSERPSGFWRYSGGEREFLTRSHHDVPPLPGCFHAHCSLEAVVTEGHGAGGTGFRHLWLGTHLSDM